VIRALAALLLLSGCAHAATSGAPEAIPMFDEVRTRDVPVLLYGAVEGQPKPLALISHGYGGRNSAYGFLADWLVARGYIVASVQNELAGDPEMPAAGEPRIVRRPFWESGAANLLFVTGELEARGLADLSRKVLLVGHSNGGDSSILLAEQHPDLVAAVFTLDHRRMPVPRTRSPRICSARSSDQVADAGVLPEAAEQAQLGMVIRPVPVIHNDMWDGAKSEQKQAMLEVLERCLAGLG
jgi:predicted dienelactone hydrolase